MSHPGNRPISRVAADLGIHHEALRLWVRKAEAGGIPAGSRVLPTEVEQELRALRKRNTERERWNQTCARPSCFSRPSSTRPAEAEACDRQARRILRGRADAHRAVRDVYLSEDPEDATLLLDKAIEGFAIPGAGRQGGVRRGLSLTPAPLAAPE